MTVERWSGLALAAALATSGASAQQLAPANAARGKEVAVTLCASCHLVAPDDPGPVSDGVPTFPSIAGRPGQTADRVRAALLGPHPLMPQSPVTMQQAVDVSAYIVTLRP